MLDHHSGVLDCSDESCDCLVFCHLVISHQIATTAISAPNAIPKINEPIIWSSCLRVVAVQPMRVAIFVDVCEVLTGLDACGRCAAVLEDRSVEGLLSKDEGPFAFAGE